MYDIVILGGGPGGYVAAERAGRMGKKVLLVEKERLGGVCLNHGCVPTKSLLNSAKLYLHALNSENYGVTVQGAEFSLEKAMKWKQNVVNTMVGGIEFLMKENGVDVVMGEGTVHADGSVSVGNETYKGNSLIIASGSSPFLLPVPGIESSTVITSRDLLQMEKLPGSLTVIGGGVIGMEFASLFSSVGVTVTVIEMLEEVLPMMDKRMAKMVRASMEEVDFRLSSRVTRIKNDRVFFEQNGKEQSVQSDYILVAVGRKANVESFKNAGIAMDRGFVMVDERMRTNLPNIYAIGDVTGKSMLAHSASRMGEVAVNTIAGKKDRMRYNAIPWALYTTLEAAGCGLTEDAAKKEGRSIHVGKYQMKNNSRFYAEHGKAAGLCKIVADADTGVILGIHFVGGVSSELIGGAAVIIESELRIQEIKEVIYPHPSLSEVIRDAVWQINQGGNDA